MYKRIYIEITNVCNLNCIFCPQTSRDKKFMSLSDFEIICSKVSNYTNNIYLHIKGEPFMHPELDSIIKTANKYNLNVNITTNGRLLPNNIDLINNNKIRQINISLHSFNKLDDVKEIINLTEGIKDTYISFRLWNNSDNSEIISFLNNFYNVNIDIKSGRFTLKSNIFLSLDNEFEWPSIDKDIISLNGTCKGLREQIGILVDGTVVSCCLDNNGDNNLGNIFKNSLEDIISSKKYQDILNGFRCKELVSPLCQRCGYIKRFK